jgi:hypothetical protein
MIKRGYFGFKRFTDRMLAQPALLRSMLLSKL